MENYFTNNIKNINFQKKLLSPRYTTYNNDNIDLSSINNIYEKKSIILQNKLFSLIIKFHTIFKKLITDINSVLITLGNQTLYSKSLLLEIECDDEKITHLNDRLEMISDTKNLLDNNLIITNNNLNMFISEVQKYFNDFKNLKNEKDKNIMNLTDKNRNKSSNIIRNKNSKSVPKGRINNNNIFLNSNPNETYRSKNNEENYITKYSEKDYNTTGNYIKIPKENYNNSINPNNTFLKYENENLINEHPRLCKSPNSFFSFNKNNLSKKIVINKSQEIIEDKKPVKIKNNKTIYNNRSKNNISSMTNENIISNMNRKQLNSIYRRNYFLSEKNNNQNNKKKKINYNCLINWNNNFKKINYREKILHNDKD